MKALNSKSALFPILAAGLILGVLYIILIPPWQSPDEPTHYEYAAVLAGGGKFWSPRSRPGLQREIIISLDRHNYWKWVGEERPLPLPETFKTAPFLSAAPTQIGKNPPGYYLPASLVLKIFSGKNLLTGFYALRVLSLIFSLLTVVMVFLCARRLFPDNYEFASAAAFTAFLPQFMVIGTSVSLDPLINCLGAVLMYLSLRLQRARVFPASILPLLAVFGIGLLVSYKFFMLFPALLFTVCLLLFTARGDGYSIGRVLAAVLIIVPAFLLAYAFLIWYFPRIARIFVSRLSLLYLTIADFISGRASFPPAFWSWFNRELFKSFWLKYGWLRFEWAPVLYLVVKIFCLGAVIGNIILLWKSLRGRSRLDSGQKRKILVLLVYAAAAVGAYYLFWGLRGANHTTTQGRHLFIVLPSWSILLVLGWGELVPGRHRKKIFAGVIVLLILLNLSGLADIAFQYL